MKSMASKTALKTLIEWGDKMMLEHPMKTLSFAEAIDKAVELLEMEKEQIEDAHIEGQRVFDKHPHTQWTNDQAEQYYNETYGSKGSDECYFEPTTNTSSATICKHCGREKFMHTELQQINQDNPVTRGSTALFPISSQTEISDKVNRLEIIDKQGRVYSQWDCSIELSYQDEGRTLKIFVNN